MKALVIKELKSVFCSSAGAFFSFAFLLVMGIMLWAFGGSYNFIDSGYANMGRFFDLSPILLCILIPALTMRQFSEEKRNGTLDILLSRPVSILSIYLSKFLASYLFILITLLPTAIYVYSLYQLANPVGNIDIESIVASYISLLLLIKIFISIGLFASSISRNQIVALVLAVFLSLFSFYGFELLAGMFLSGKIQAIISSVGLVHHYQLMQRGVIQLKDLLVVFNYVFIFSIFTLVVLRRSKGRIVKVLIILAAVLNVVFLSVPNLRLDFTADKRYTLNDYSKNLLAKVGEQESVKVNVYLAGDLNAGFQHLQDAVSELLTDFNRYADNKIEVAYKNPYQLYPSIQDMYKAMTENDMPGIVLNEVDREGKSSQKVIYPYAELTTSKGSLIVPLLKNIAGYTADENLNASIESLEFEFIDAIRLLNQENPKNIAFIEGHGELPRAYVYDAEEALSKYYFVNRGEIGKEIGILNELDAIIIAGPIEKYTEEEKYIIDQYIMSGGKVLWLVDGVYYSQSDLARDGFSPSMKNDVSLDDLLFSYGVRINSDLVQDKQSASIYLMTGDDTQSATLLPFYYMPLLIPSPDDPITKNIRDVKTAFASSVDIVNNLPQIQKTILLTSSANTHLVKVPEMIDFDVEKIQNQSAYFDQQYIPVAVSLEGEFNSAFTNRMIPDSVVGQHKAINTSKKTKMIVAASSEIIRNEIEGQGEDSHVLPMGYDRVSQRQYGNRDFIVNAVNWLTDDDGWMQLRSKHQHMRILNKKESFENRDKYAVLNIAFPVLFMGLIMGGIFMYRKRKYEK
ncbi:gliding motility-associated ABC transporter substrate-binding protein GldG [Dysgonomonas sp. ZJ279]|uniref:gliding motility-associated ABC transporter substrate-binding protein GldG n=1 Tax=Dysgonomonas sp. ZJ279 TaxID=2709796 RepID=UPI0013EA35BA|nr:gliding motility-associated ABC transporter substrate-binding protein GldG [Dysgonomonas sp. ZJ279]